MKNIRINFLAIIGMMVAIGTVAFTAPKSANSSGWFAVENDGVTINPIALSEAPEICTEEEGQYCALKLNTDGATSFPETVSQAETMHANNELVIDARAYKELE